MRLLLAEDDRMLSDALVEMLTHNNYSVDPVYDGEDALYYLQNGEYDGAILDIMNDRRETPTLLMGDLNEWRLNDRSALAMFETAFGELPPAVPSFPSRLPLLALDRLISNRKEILSPVIAHDTPLARLASDHLPIKAWVNLAPAQSTPVGNKLQAA